ncbi:hypothetical protein AB1Y20_008762 [Prymnesium parvum]
MNPSADCTVDTSRSLCRSSSPAPSRPTCAQQDSEHVLGNPNEHVSNPSSRSKEHAATDKKQTKSLWRELAPMSTTPPRQQFLACVTIALLGVGLGVVNRLSHRRATAHLAEAKTALQTHQKLAALTALDFADEEIARQSRFSLCHLWHCQSTLILLTASLLRAQALETPPVNLDAALSEIERALTLLEELQADDDSEEAARQLALMEGRIHHRRGNWSRAIMAFGRVKPSQLQAELAHVRLLCESQLQAINASVTPRSKVVDEWLGTRLERVACGEGPCGAHRAQDPDSTSAVWCAEAKLQECRLQSARKEYSSKSRIRFTLAQCNTSLVVAAQKRIADCQIDQALQAIISSASSRGGKPRAATLAVYQAAISAKRCAREHEVIELLCVEVISSGIADADVYEMLADALIALRRPHEALKAFRQAYELIPEWQVLSSWRVFLKIKIFDFAVSGGGGGAFDRGRGKADSPECSEQVMDGDDYTVLGVDRFSCSRKRLKSAFRKAALKYHPDKYTGTKECAEMHFRHLSNAHDRLRSVCT